MNWKPDICIYHANCSDGFGAAWAVHSCWGDDVVFIPASYGEAPPNVRDKNVLIVDFSYKADVLEWMGEDATSIVVLDHHKTAEADLNEFPTFFGTKEDVVRALARTDCRRGRVLVNFDSERSGAIMAWEFCHKGRLAPAILQYVQDRDLWRFALDDSKELNACIGSLDHRFDAWSKYFPHPTSFDEGKAILRQQRKNMDTLLSATLRRMRIGGHDVPVANLPFYMASDAGSQLAIGEPFAASYFDRHDGQRQFSLRSSASGLDVSEIARIYGGGGHKHAAGFSVPLGWEGDGDSGNE